METWHWAPGGVAIGMLVPLMYFWLNKALGVSTGYGNILKKLCPGTRLGYLNSETFQRKTDGRLWMLGGMVLGGFLSNLAGGGALATLEMGAFTRMAGLGFWQNGLFFFAGGLLLGFGGRMAGGCTSGNSITGIATGQKGSLAATVCFLLAGAAAANLLRFLLSGGVTA